MLSVDGNWLGLQTHGWGSLQSICLQHIPSEGDQINPAIAAHPYPSKLFWVGNGSGFPGINGGGGDGDALDGDALDGGALDGDALDGDALDGDALDGDALDGDALDGGGLGFIVGFDIFLYK
jgi:hypothetical protein